MIDLDEKWDPPTRDQLREEVGGVALADNGNSDHGPYIVFRSVCGAEGYFCSAQFRDHEGHGGGATAREAMLSLAKGLRNLANRVEKAAAIDEPQCICLRGPRGSNEDCRVCWSTPRG